MIMTFIISVGPSIVTNVPLMGEVDGGGGCACVRFDEGGGAHTKSLHFALNISMSLKLLLKV